MAGAKNAPWISNKGGGLGSLTFRHGNPIFGPPEVELRLCKLVAKAPSGPGWVHEVRFDGYPTAARIDHDDVQLLIRSGLDWTEKYPETARPWPSCSSHQPISTANSAASEPTA